MNPWLDALRALAIGLVLLRHGIRAWPESASGAIGTFMLNGWVGVDVFFVLSGYLIARHLLAAGIGTPQFSYGRYLRRRAARIVPAYVVAMLAMFTLVAPALDRPMLTLLYHLLFLQDYLPSSLNVVFWSLGVEAKFYLLVPPVLALALRARATSTQAAWLLAALLLPLVLRAGTMAMLGSPLEYEPFFRWLRSPAHTSLEPLVLGVAVAVAEHRGALSARPATSVAWLVAGAYVLGGWLASHELMASIGWMDATVQPLGLSVAMSGMLVGCVTLGTVPMPGARVARVAATLAYCLYLVHYPLTPLAAVAARANGNATLIFWCAYLGLSLAAAVLLHLCVERPGMALAGHGARARHG